MSCAVSEALENGICAWEKQGSLCARVVDLCLLMEIFSITLCSLKTLNFHQTNPALCSLHLLLPPEVLFFFSFQIKVWEGQLAGMVKS